VEAKDRYFDEETGHYIAVMEVELYDKVREVMVAYAVESNTVNLLTVHPPGKWRKI